MDGINQSVGATFLPGVFGPGAEPEPNGAPTRLLRDLLTHMSERIDGQPYRSPWGSLFAAAIPAPDGGYFLSHDRRLLYVVIDLVDAPRTFDAEHAAIVTIRRTIASLRPQFPSVEAGVSTRDEAARHTVRREHAGRRRRPTTASLRDVSRFEKRSGGCTRAFVSL